MIAPKLFVETLQEGGIDFFSGVPDSLLKNFCAYLTDHIEPKNHIIAANEGGAVALAAGYHLATGKTGCVYMQNSGEGNAVNPLLSLVDREVYNIPLLLIIGWRGEPNVHDEPQHVKQGKVTLSLLKSMDITYAVLDDTWQEQLHAAIEHTKHFNGIYALIVRKGIFDEYKLQNTSTPQLPLSREEAIKAVVNSLRDDDIVVSTTGMISRELYEYRDAKQQGHANDFLTVGSMGHASQIALSIALQRPNRRIVIFDGDGAAIMHMGGMAIIGDYCPNNIIHIVFNNGAHDSVGGQPTVGQKINFCQIAQSVGYKHTYNISTKEELENTLSAVNKHKLTELTFVNINVRKGNRSDLGRPKTTPIENKTELMNNLAHFTRN